MHVGITSDEGLFAVEVNSGAGRAARAQDDRHESISIFAEDAVLVDRQPLAAGMSELGKLPRVAHRPRRSKSRANRRLNGWGDRGAVPG
jgi:hypothetical protein